MVSIGTCPSCGHRVVVEQSGLRQVLTPVCGPVIREFVERVNRRAETEMMETDMLEGAHHRAIEAELATIPEELGR